MRYSLGTPARSASAGACAAGLLLCALTGVAGAQDRLKTMPGYEQYEKMRREIPGSVKMGILRGEWKDGGKAFAYLKDGKGYRFDFATGTTKEQDATDLLEPPVPGGRGGRGFGPGRGQQFRSALSPDGKFSAFYRDRNLWISDAAGKGESALTTDGSEKSRIKYGAADWVYGEELNQTTAMWWSPDSRKIAYYRFDESHVPDYFLALNQTQLHSALNVEAYPKTGDPNPIVTLFIYDVETKKTVQADVWMGRPYDNSVLGYYVYDVRWSPAGQELLFNRTNRRQNILEFTACDPNTGKCRTVVHEEWLPGWTENHPALQFLKDGKRFIWTSERNGWKNFALYDLTGKLLVTLTNHRFEVANIVRLDEAAGLLYYMARDGDNPLKLQLHRVGLDGKGDRRLTDATWNHTVDLAPDGRHFLDIAQSHDQPPVTRLVDADGKVVVELAKSDTAKFDQLGMQRPELLTFKAADGQTDLYGLLYKPSHFDPQKKYPLLVSVYAGPETVGSRESFSLSGSRESFGVLSALTEYGFLVATFDSRGASGRGKAVLDALYGKLGIVEMDDQAAGVKSLWNRPYLDKARVGIYGTSYGGYAATMCLLRHPEAFRAAVASSPVTDFRLYDSIYTERYMGLPEENQAGYKAGSAMNYADKLNGRLLLYFGTADNNVHPSNALQLIQALQRAGKSFEVQVGPDQGHSAVSQARMMEFFIENLVVAPPMPPAF